jgi:hypothetical protein
MNKMKRQKCKEEEKYERTANKMMELEEMGRIAGEVFAFSDQNF